MCGRFTSTSTIDELVQAFDVDVVRTEPLPLRYNVAPTQQIYAVATRRSAPSGTAGATRALGTFRWGLVPSWAKDLSSAAKMINARAESVGQRPAFRHALIKRRCVIPIDGFYEWQAVPGRKGKQPWAIARRDRGPMGLAGLWEIWRDPAGPRDAEPVRTCTIVTTAANDALRAIHERMPVVLGAEALDRWLDPTIEDRDELESLLMPAPSEWFRAYPVSTLVNRVSEDRPELMEPLRDAEAPTTVESSGGGEPFCDAEGAGSANQVVDPS